MELQVSGLFFKDMVQVVLIFGTDTLVPPPPPHGQGPGGVTRPGGMVSDGVSLAEENRREVGLHLVGNGKGGGGVIDNGC